MRLRKTRLILLGLLAVAVFAVPAFAAMRTRRFVNNITGGSSPFTGAVPSATACDLSEGNSGSGATKGAVTGLNLEGLSSYTVCLEVANGQTLSGGGTVDVYYYDLDLAAWAYAPGKQESLTSCSGKRRCCLDARAIARSGVGPGGSGGVGCYFFTPNAATASGGTTLNTAATGPF